MKFPTKAIFTTALSVFLSHPVNAQGLVLQLNTETGEFIPFDPKKEEGKQDITPVSLPFTARIFKPNATMQPSQSVLEQIEATARKYIGAKALSSANLTAQEWMALYRANIEIESAYNPAAVSKAGAFGLGQLLPKTAAQLKVNIDDPADNLRGSAEYLLGLLETFGSPDLAIAAYNAGPEAVAQNGGVPPFVETREHVRKVLGVFFRLRKHYL